MQLCFGIDEAVQHLGLALSPRSFIVISRGQGAVLEILNLKKESLGRVSLSLIPLANLPNSASARPTLESIPLTRFARFL